MKKLIIFMLAIIVLASGAKQKAAKTTKKTEKATPKKTELQKPNIVIFLADDLGIGDVGCFGNDTIKTPNIDSICKKGVKLSQHLTADALCTPSRSALLTGRMPVRTGMATDGLVGVFTSLGVSTGLPTNETTFATQLKKVGYNTGLIGKWHLGTSRDRHDDYVYAPNNHGFDYYFGIPLSNFRNMRDGDWSMLTIIFPVVKWNILSGIVITIVSLYIIKRMIGKKFAMLLAFIIFSLVAYIGIHLGNGKVLAGVLMRNKEIIEQPYDLMEDMAERLVREGFKFLEKQEGTGKPFLLYMPWIQVHNAMHASKRFQGHSVHGHYGDDVEELDWSVGQILDALEQFKLMDNTIVYFSSDNGGHIEEHHRDGYRTGGYNGIFRGGKGQGGQEGGIRVPSAIMWPGQLPAGKEVSVPTSQMDVFVTLLPIVGLPIPADRIYDGTNILPYLKGESQVPPHRFLFHQCGVWLHAVRYTPGNGEDVYKVYYYWPNWKEGKGDGCDAICLCLPHHRKLDIPIITNVQKDPSERNHLDPKSQEYKNILEVVTEAKQNHEQSLTPVPNQLKNMGITSHRPWLQPCCNKSPWMFPFCTCKEDKNNALNYKAPWER